MRLSDEEITAVRNSADIAEVIGHYVPLVKKGRSMACVCPFHDDHDPSLSISQDKQIYKCFVCGAGGNVFTFVQNYEKVSFPEAVAKVAEISGYKLSFDPSAFKTPVDPRKDALYKVLAETIRYTHYQLGAQAGTPVREYLANRGIDEATIEKFEIGWNGPGDELLRFLQAKGYNEQDMVAANVVRLNESGLHDVFASRITFPIHDSLGNPIGFTARSMDPEAQSKYINTTETDVYVKGHTVFNYHRAKQPSRQEGRVLLCEGVTDVLAFSRAGMDNVVATLGTACTKEQLRLLRQCSLHLTFCYDGDKAGQNALVRTQLKRSVLLIPITVGFLCSVVLVGIYFIGIVLQLDNIFSAQYFIPIFGILMGNMLSSNVIALNTYYSGLKREQQLYRYLLGNGATRQEAQAPFIRQAIIKSFSPLIANIAVMGLVALPGTMIGQILGGSSPNVAIKYQMMIMVITFTASMLSLMITISLASRRSFDAYGKLLEVTKEPRK